MSHMSLAEFERTALADGFDEVLVREWAPGQRVDTHTHPFAVRALVVRGDLTLICGEEARSLQAGENFELGCEVPHAEQYGAQGATFWVARRHRRD